MGELDGFIKACKERQPGLAENYGHYFNGVIALPIEQETLLQAYLANNFVEIFHTPGEPILYERPLPNHNVHEGKLDFVYLTEPTGILVIETKYVDFECSGRNRRCRRTDQRGEVLEQAKKANETILLDWSIPPELVRCCVFSNDEQITRRGTELGIDARHVDTSSLLNWRRREYLARFKREPIA